MATRRSGILRALNILGLAILFLLMLASLSIYLLPHFGWRVDNLSSGSMEPELSAGDLVVTSPVEPEAVEVGDIIAFYSTDAHENLVSHRVVSIERNPSLSFITKGDAYITLDPFIVTARNLVGRVYFHAPLLGYAVAFLKTTPGLLVALVAPGLVIVAVCMKRLRSELKKTRGKSRGEEA